VKMQAATLFVLVGVLSSVNGLIDLNVGTDVQLFEWSWPDVAYECENFLSKKGYRSVQVSPPTEHIQGSQWWTRYQPVTYTLTSRSGNEAQFKDMIHRCAAVNVSIVVDAVINHMAAGSGTGIAGSAYGSRQYPFYGPQDFHHNSNSVTSNCQVNDYTNKYNVQYCDLVGLPDLLTSSDYVQGQIAAYINKVASYGVKGIRIDAAKHQDANELAGITRRLPSSNFYIGTEVIGSAGEAVQPSMYYSIGQVTEFYFSDYLCDNVKVENKMQYLKTFGETWGLMPDKYAAVFMDNHDTQRNGRAQLTYKNGDLYTFANIFMLAWNYGNPRVMSSYYFTNTDMGPPSVGVSGGKNCMDNKNWVCEHRWGPIANMVAWRKTAKTSGVSNWQQGNANQIAFSRGNAFIALNRGSSTWTATLKTGLAAGTYCQIIGDTNADNIATCPTVTVDASGSATFTVKGLSAAAIHAGAKK
jgi:alpha-amylase